MSFQDDFNELVIAVEDQGGVHLPIKCTGRALTFGDNQKALARTCNCRKMTILMVNYDQGDDVTDEDAGLAQVCGFCDSVTVWPRFTEPELQLG